MVVVRRGVRFLRGGGMVSKGGGVLEGRMVGAMLGRGLGPRGVLRQMRVQTHRDGISFVSGGAASVMRCPRYVGVF
jgi:hypothetical protein